MENVHIGIIGGGMMGLSTAFYLAREGAQITVIEKEKEIGGLSRSEEIMPHIQWDRYYHAILSTDDDLLSFIQDLGLKLDVQFAETKTGFFTDGRLHSMSSTLEFLKFKPLTLWDKLRLGIGILYASQIKDWKRLEKKYVKSWLVQVFGRRNYEKIWDPLLRCKLGPERHHASAAFIWATINRYYGTRQGGSKKEMMGYVRGGGYHSILNGIKHRLLENGGSVVTGCGAERLEPMSNGGIRLLRNGGDALEFDRVVATVPNPEIVRLWPNMPSEFRTRLETVRYLGLICLTLVLNRSLSPFYVTNLTDPDFPFTGVIELTNLISKEEVDGNNLVYLPRYLPSDDDFFHAPDKEVFNIYFEALKRMFPDISSDNVLSWAVNHENYVQPVMEILHSEKIPPMKTPLSNFYMVNTTMILNSNLNNNKVLQLAKKMATFLLEDE